jgi:asparagine synthase (glutamine-hydrolysing)
MADVDLGVFLSGGIDSSVIASLAAAESPAPVSTFTIGFDDRSFDESSYADLVSRFIGSKHHMEVLSLDNRVQVIPDIIAGLDEPIGDSSLIPTWFLSKMARTEVKVVLGGDGGDELFAGYDPFEALARARFYSKVVPRPVHQGISALAGLLPVSHRYMSMDFKVKRSLGALGHPTRLWPALWMAPVSPEGLNELFGTSLSLEDLYSEAVEAWEECQQESPVHPSSMWSLWTS